MVTRPQYVQPPAGRGSANGAAAAASFHEKAWVEQYAAAKVPNSIEMLARFQQKQLQEKEQKLLQLYDQQQQRAHQVAQRGSAGSNGSNHTVSPNTNKVKQLFADERRVVQQNGVKGIDKSYPLEPLKSKKTSPVASKPTPLNNNNNNNGMTNRKFNSNGGGGGGGTKRVIKADVNSNRSISNFAATASSRQHQQESNLMSRESYHREASGSESIRQVNGHGTNNGYHYEINIDEVIDNEALQRNRMLAKFQPGDIERRRRQLSGAGADIDDEFPEDAHYYRHHDDGAAVVVSRKSSLKNTKSNPTIASVGNANKKTNPRQSTVMKTTQSASLKVTKPAQNRSRLVMRRKSSLIRKPKKPVPETPKRKKSVEPPPPVQQERCCEISERCFPPPWNTLKSTSLICEIIRKHSKLQQMRNKSSKMGRVKTIVTKIENQTIAIKPTLVAGGGATTTTTKFVPVAKSIEKRLLEMTRDVEPAAAVPSTEPLDLLNANFVEALKAAEMKSEIESEDQGDGLVTEKPSDCQEITVEPPKLTADSVNRVRRASFEQKRMMFELLHRRHNSDESILRQFDDDEPEDEKKRRQRSCHRKGSTSSDSGQRIMRGFERSTSAWTMRTSSSRKSSKRSSSKKILEARDSIELARVPVMTNLPACKRKIILHSRRNDDDDAQQIVGQRDDDDDDDDDRGRSSSPEVSAAAKIDSYVTSTTTSLKKADSVTKVADASSAAVKNVPPYPSSKSPENTEPRSRSVVKSTSMKLLSRFAASNGDVNTVPTETDHYHQQRKSSIHATTEQPTPPSDEKMPTSARAPITPAPRTSSSSSSIGPTRSQGSRPAPANKAKTPTPAVRTTAPSSADDSLVACKICSRRFQSERIVKHEQICAKTAQKKRKQFDALGHRVKGTELESFVTKPSKKLQSKAPAVVSKPESQKSNWRRKHEDFINAIRAAKEMQAHLAAGGKLTDLPPPPPSDTSDYVQCPHCSRKFSHGAAERHIPKCETMQHNKPKPRPKR